MNVQILYYKWIYIIHDDDYKSYYVLEVMVF